MSQRLQILFIFLLSASVSFAKVDTKVKAVVTAAQTGDSSQFNKLIKDKSIDLNAQDEEGMTPLMSAALGGHVGIVKQLLSKKVKLETKNPQGDTALAVALSNDKFEVAKLLINSGANVDITVAGDEGDSLLMRAASNDLKTTELILKKKKSLVNKTNKLGETALIQSTRFGQLDIVKLLLKNGADTKLKDKEGQTALDIAKKSQNQEAVQLLSAKK